MAKIHHNTAKKAKVHGITLTVSDVDGAIVATLNGKVLAEHLSGSVCLEQAIAKLNGAAPVKTVKAKKAHKVAAKGMDDADFDEDDADFDEDGEPDPGNSTDEDEGRSIVKKKYKTRYRPFRMTCGDDLAKLVSGHVKIHDEEADELRIDAAKLKRFAQGNDCWQPNYAKLNVGMQRMNCVNRLRAKVRKGYEVKWVK